MDSKDSIINEIKNFIPFINEEFLISISNKGIYKRSLKDLEKLKENINISLNEENKIKIDIEDINVILDINIQQSSCTCPSSSICKHIIMSLLFLKEYYENNSQKDVQKVINNKEDYIQLKELTQETALELIGKKDYIPIVQSVFIRNEAEFEYSNLLTVTIASQNVKVYFPKENSIKNSMCSCKEKNFCKHRAYAIISYLIKENKITDNLESDNSFELGDKEYEFLNNIMEYISMFFDTGITSLTEIEIKRTEKFYIQSYGMKLFQMATEIKNLSSELNLYFSKNVSFSSSRLLKTLCIIYNRAYAILISKNDIKKRNILVGTKKEDSFQLDNISVIGLGATCRLTKRNDLMVIVYFYCKDIKSIISMSTLRPMESQNITPEFLYNSSSVWAEDISFRIASTSKMILKNAKLTTGKISNTKSTTSKLKGETLIEDIKDISIENYSMLKEILENRTFNYFEPYSEVNNIFIVKVNKLEFKPYDKVNQKLSFFVFDLNENKIEFEIKYNSVTKNAIEYIERRKDKKIFQYILGNIKEKNGVLKGSFLSGFSEGKIKNIFFKG